MLSEVRADVAIVGGGLGGVAAALAALRLGHTVVMTEEHGWLGGQLTVQAVPPDEHRWVESFGVTRSYRQLREGIRAYYRSHYPLTAKARQDPHLNPGQGNVSRLCHEPRVAVAVIDQMLAPYVSSGALAVLRQTVAVGVDLTADRVRGIVVESRAGERTRLRAEVYLDATETGDLLALGAAEFVSGAESRDETGEPSAAEAADPLNMQAATWCFAFDEGPVENVIGKPEGYDFWHSYQPDFWGAPLLSFTAPDPRTQAPITRTMDVNPHEDAHRTDTQQAIGDRDLWVFRRIAAKSTFTPGHLQSDIVLANWPMLDYLEGPVFGSPDAEEHLRRARSLSLSYFYWLQTEAPRPDGGQGWPRLRLRGDVLGTPDGLAQSIYIRESRRIKAVRTILEQDISVEASGTAEPARFADTVGVGMYRIDIHPSTGGDNYIDVACRPFEIPLSALVPARTSNLLAAGKTLGTTHVSNGAYRLHPVEWNIGEAAGVAASHAIRGRSSVQDLVATPRATRAVQSTLDELGVERSWPEVQGY